MMVAALVVAAIGAADGQAQVVNGDFSQPGVKGLQFVAQEKVTGWKTDDSKGQIEIWTSGMQVAGGPKFDTPPGIRQFAEVNANSHGTLSQEVRGIRAGSQYGFSFWHRGRHSATEGDTIEVTVKDGAKVWSRTFNTTNAAWKQYTVSVGTKAGDGPVLLSFRSKSTASKDDTIGNFLTGVKLDSTVVPPPCALNAAGEFLWFSDNKSMGITILNADGSSRNLRGNPPKDFLKGVWQVTNDCQVTINWGNGQFFDTLKMNPDGKQMIGKNQKNMVLRGDRKP
jgi:hypothetical protein